MKLFTQAKELLNDFLSLIYPDLCVTCDNDLMKQEHLICSKCLIELPRTHYHLVKDNPVEIVFWGRVPIEKATAYFLFQKGSKYQKLLHQLKYKGMRTIGVEMGKYFGSELIQNNYFGDVDFLVPVPLHPKKERKRGYNQSLAIAEGIGKIIGKETLSNVLYRAYYSETQTRKGRFERWENVNDLFKLNNAEKINGKHILLVDDIVTTGSTLEACAKALLAANNVKVSIATLGYSNQ